MRFLNLHNEEDFRFEPEVNRSIIDFPSGFETTIRVDKSDEPITIIAKIKKSKDLFLIAQGVDAIRSTQSRPITLLLPFLPNARQDRRMVSGDAFGLKVFANFLNSLELSRVILFDPHSEVAPALINNSVVIPQWEFVTRVLPKDGNYKLVAPDVGALKKTQESAHILDKEVIIANKHRIPATGQIVDIDVWGDVKDQILYIVDDICDGGATFIILAKKLKELGAKEVHLVVSHGIFSKGFHVLSILDSITTTNSLWTDPFKERFPSAFPPPKVINLRDFIKPYLEK
jgi:ribose-phosphate pyrophosphokinase